MRQVVMGIEVTGLSVEAGNRVIEMGCVELVDGEPTGVFWHTYINPECPVEERVFNVHGLGDDFLRGKPTFSEVVNEFFEFIANDDLIIYHVPFDIGFLNNEIKLILPHERPLDARCNVIDVYTMAKNLSPGERCNMLSVAKRYDISLPEKKELSAVYEALLVARIYDKLSKLQEFREGAGRFMKIKCMILNFFRCIKGY